MAGRKKEVSEEVQKQIIELYVDQKLGLDNIGKKLNLSRSVIKTQLKDNGIHIRNFQEAKPVDTRKYPINDDYELNSRNGAWLLGFLASDGYFPITANAKHRIVIGLQRRDEEVLYQIAKELNFQGQITQYMQGQYEESSLAFSSIKLRNKIEKDYNIGHDKTFNLHNIPIKLDEKYKIDFIRGYWDGDGSIYEPSDGHKIRMNLVSVNEDFLINIVSFLEKEYQIPKVTIHQRWDKNSTVPLFYINYSTNSSFALGHIFYDNLLEENITLKRKKEKFLEICQKYNK